MSAKLEIFIKGQFPRNAHELSAEILKYCTRRICRRNEFLSRPGESKEFFFFINSGCLRKYVIASNGMEDTRNIAFEGECIVNLQGDNNTKVRRILKKVFPKSNTANRQIYVQAIERSELTVISTKYRELLYSTTMDFYCAMICLLKDEQDTIKWIDNLNAKEKYEWLLRCKPQIIQHVPGKIIASYLGISPSTLSRMRSKRNNYDNGRCQCFWDEFN